MNEKGKESMRRSVNTILVLSITWLVFLFGCEATDSDSGWNVVDLETLGKQKQQVTVCDFGTNEITTGKVYSVSVTSKDIKTRKPYLVEVTINNNTETLNGEVKEKGTMHVCIR